MVNLLRPQKLRLLPKMLDVGFSSAFVILPLRAFPNQRFWLDVLAGWASAVVCLHVFVCVSWDVPHRPEWDNGCSTGPQHASPLAVL